ncbi:MAG: TonB family protein [Aquificae bacterium]|nr:TonB family protein [Aquificota bacterium]
MELYLQNKSYLNKKVLFISLLIGLVVNLLLLWAFGVFTANPPQMEKKEVKIRYIPVKKPVAKKKKPVKKKIQERKKAVKSPVEKAPKPKGSETAKVPSVPALTPVLPEVELPSEESVPLPEREIDIGKFSDLPVETGDIKEFKATTVGEFNPSFGTELSKFDRTATGTAIGRRLVYKPPPPVIKAKVPPPSVKVKLWIRKDGTVSKVVLLETTGNKAIDQKIKEYVQSWKFNEIKDDQEQWAITTIRFKTAM